MSKDFDDFVRDNPKGVWFQYKGYKGKVVFDNEVGIFHGEVINMHDVVTFHGKSVMELRKALKDSIDEYLEFCKELGREPVKPG